MPRDIHCALICPPLTDPTSGYHSLPYLATAVRAAGRHRVSIIDANIEALIWCARPSHVRRLQEGLDLRLDLLKASAIRDRRTFLACSDVLFGLTLSAESAQDAMAVLRDGEQFWDAAAYRTAALTLERWLRLLATSGAPGMFSRFDVVNVNLRNSAFFTDEGLLSQLGAPFESYVHEQLIPRLEAEAVDVVGIGATYRAQLPFALYFAQEIRKQLPKVRCLLGGTDVSQLWKFCKDGQASSHLLRFADAVVIGEGEHALLDILDAYALGREPEGAGILSRQHPSGGPGWGPRYENVDGLPTPSFHDSPWDEYLSPERLVLYSPTRGCYWDRCTFCDYGLAADRPTSPWRQRSVPRVIEDLKAITQDARFIYLSVDVIAPAYLVRLAQAIVDARIDIRWSAELRLEKYFDEAHCSLLRESGCVGVSVGFESGNQRVLDLIDKGTKVQDVRRVVRALSRAGIGVQIMGFTGFPSESYDEAVDSVQMLKELRDDWVFGGLSTFQLTAGSIVAKQPQRFGLAQVSSSASEDLGQFLEFTEVRRSKTAREERQVAQQSAELNHPLALWRPFLGGIDSPHTLFYLARYGKAVKSHLGEALGLPGETAGLALEGRVFERLPPSLVKFLGDSATTNVTEIAVLVGSDGRLHECPRFVADLAGLLDGYRTERALVAAAHDRFGLPASTVMFGLRFLGDRRALRFVPVPPRTAGFPDDRAKPEAWGAQNSPVITKL